ncbi:MAG: DUF493 domain-containing protein [Pseudomonadota bacterium]
MGDMPKIEFPCAYPIKVIGYADKDSITQIIDIVRQHAPEVTPDQVSSRDSSAGNYHSIRVEIQATGEAQLKALHTDLLALDAVKLVL